MAKFYVLSKSRGYVIKSRNTEAEARQYAERCNQTSPTNDYIVCEYKGGIMCEI